MGNISYVNRNLWIITGMASIPFAVLAFFKPELVIFPYIYYVFTAAVIFNGFIVPFLILKGEANWYKKTISMGVNLFFAYLWIHFTGDVQSIFYPNFFFLPIIAATVCCGFIDSLITALLASIITMVFKYNSDVTLRAILSGNDAGVLVSIVLFFLTSSIIGYLIKTEKEQQQVNQKITFELETAYQQLTATHEQLQSYTDIIENMNKEMEQLAVTDELTMLYNYRYFQVTLDKEIKRNKYSSVTLMMLDIDYFKQFNDKFGHITGNKLLAEIAGIMKQNVRGIDTVVRYGGEEFAVILPATEPDEAYVVAERIRKVTEEFVLKTKSGSAGITASVGIATYPKDAKNKSELISHADLALYEAKQTGRNRVCIYNGK